MSKPSSARSGRPGSSAGSHPPDLKKDLQGNRSCMLRIGERLMRAGSEGNLVPRPCAAQSQNPSRASASGQEPDGATKADMEDKAAEHADTYRREGKPAQTERCRAKTLTAGSPSCLSHPGEWRQPRVQKFRLLSVYSNQKEVCLKKISPPLRSPQLIMRIMNAIPFQTHSLLFFKQSADVRRTHTHSRTTNESNGPEQNVRACVCGGGGLFGRTNRRLQRHFIHSLGNVTQSYANVLLRASVI